MPDDNENCKRGALAIERQIDRRLEALNVPIPSRTWLLDVEKRYTAEVEITYECAGNRIAETFSVEETRAYRHQPLPETVRKISQIVVGIRDAHERNKIPTR